MKLYPKIFFILKLSFSIVLIYYLNQNNKFNFKNIELGMSNFRLAIIFFVLTFFQLFLASIRTYFLMQFKTTNNFHFKKILSISWASVFISCIAPIPFLGDLFKIKKLINLDSSISRDNTFYASAFSKIFSIFGLVIISIFASFYMHLHPREIQVFLYFLYGLLLLLVLLLITRKKILLLFSPLFERTYRLFDSQFFLRRLDNFKKYNLILLSEKKHFLLSVLLSLLIQILNIISFLIIIYALNPKISYHLGELICVIPLGIFAMTLPISFSGLGVGHVAFSKILNLFEIPNGADVFTIFFAFSYIFNFFGLIPFFMQLKRK